MKNIDKTEREYLIELKLREGKGITEASEEVKRDIEHINGLNEMKKRLTREIKEIEKEKKKVDNQFKKEFLKLQKVIEKPERMGKTKVNANTKHLNRVMNYLTEFGEQGVSKISKENCMSNALTHDALRFLIKLEKVKENYSNGHKLYQMIK